MLVAVTRSEPAVPDPGSSDGTTASSLPGDPTTGPAASAKGASVAVAMAVMNISTYGYTMLAARVLGPQPYGEFVALMATLLVVGVAQLGLQAVAARRIAADHSHASAVRASILRVTLRASLALGLVVLLATPLLDHVLKLSSVWSGLLVGVTVVPMTLMGGQAGILQGMRRWTALSWVFVANGLPRLLLGTALIWWRPDTVWAMLAVCLTQFVPVLVAGVALGARPTDTHGHEHHGLRGVTGEAVHASLTLLAFYALCGIDIVVARNQLPAHDAGLYAGGLILVKAVLFMPQFVVVVAFPSMSTPSQRSRALAISLGLVAAVGAVCIAGAKLLPGLAMVFVGGDKFSEIESSLWAFAVLGTLEATLQLLVYSVLARQSRRTSVLVWAALLAVVGVGLGAHTWHELVNRVILVDAILCAVLLGLSWWRLRDTGASDEPADELDPSYAA